MEELEGTSMDNFGSPRKSRRAKHRNLARWMWGLAILGILGVIGVFVLLSFSDLPSFKELENPKSNLASPVYASNGEVLGRYYVENRTAVFYEDLSPNMVEALIATEDERYFDHSGIDPKGLARAISKTVVLQDKSAGGASTITQQLSKLLFTGKPGSGLARVVQKLKEWIISLRLERKYTKKEIMAMYLNKFNFINGAYGIKAAAEIYFNKSQKDLDVLESAMLVGMLKNPSLFNPVKRPDTTAHRRMVVLKQMQKNEILTQIEYDSLRQVPLDMSQFNRKTHADGLAPYFRMELRKELFKILANEEVRKPDGTKYDIFRDGLKIYTTIDPKVQALAEEAMLEHMTQLQETFFKRWKNEDPWTFREEETTDEEMVAREKTMTRLIEESDRYGKLRAATLEPKIKEVSASIDGYILKDYDIKRMLSEEKDKGAIAQLVSRKLVPNERARKYRQLMRSEDWKTIKSSWRKLQRTAETSFQTPTKMTVFAYNDEMETDTTMTPLDSIKYHRMFLQLGSVSVDPRTGYVKSWVGGINHKYFQFDHVRTNRQVGSTFKPFVYATAIAQQGISPCFEVDDIPYTIHPGEGNFYLKEPWTPSNANDHYSGDRFTLRRGLQFSKNTVSVFLMKQLGDAEPVRDLVQGMGIPKAKVPPAPSICLGATDLSVFEMTGAYTAFANNGIYSKPIFITRIIDNKGREIFTAEPEEHQALHPNPNYVMLDMLKSTVTQLKGGRGFGGLKSEIGGKTGTTNDYVDGWFMGITPTLVVGTWVGGEDRWVRFRSLRYGIGATMARPFFAKLLQKLEKTEGVDYDNTARFNRPPGDLGIVMDCGEYIDPLADSNGEEGEDGISNDAFGDEDPFGEEDVFGGEDAFSEPKDTTKIEIQ